MSETAIVIGVGALRGLGATLCRRFAKSGLHVFIGGRTPEKIEAVAELIRSEGGLVDLDGIAAIYEMLYCQPRAAWSHEIDVRTHKESF